MDVDPSDGTHLMVSGVFDRADSEIEAHVSLVFMTIRVFEDYVRCQVLELSLTLFEYELEVFVLNRLQAGYISVLYLAG